MAGQSIHDMSREKWHELQVSISHSKHFTTVKDMAEFLGLKSPNKKAIEKYIQRSHFYGVRWDE